MAFSVVNISSVTHKVHYVTCCYIIVDVSLTELIPLILSLICLTWHMSWHFCHNKYMIDMTSNNVKIHFIETIRILSNFQDLKK